jgi:molecular chaperone DnaK
VGAVSASLVLDLGTHTAGAAVVTDQGVWIVPDPTSQASRWPSAVHWDGRRATVGAWAERQGHSDPAGFSTGFLRGLELDQPMLLGARRFRPVEQLAELVGAMRAEAQRQHGPTDRALLTIGSDWAPGDPRRTRLVSAVEAAGFGAVELLAGAVAALTAPWLGLAFEIDDLVLVYDLGAGFEATVVRVGPDYTEVLGHTLIADWAGRDLPGMVDLTLSVCRDLLDRLDLAPHRLAAVLAIGGACRAPGVGLALERGLPISVRRLEEPELAVLRGAAHWLPRSGQRTVAALPPADRLVPLSFQIPGGSAELLRWLVPLRQPYDEGAVLARIRLGGGAVWELTARSRGTLAQVLVGDGAPVRTGDWLALAHP